MFCKRCYANLDQATDGRCLRCRRPFDPNQPTSYLPRPFPSRRRMIIHTIVTLILATIVSAAVAGFVAVFQSAHMHDGH
jgi:hypothetical protein